MTENEAVFKAAPERVYALLLEAWSFPDWIVGAKKIRAVDPDWPAPGSAFHHTIGVGPVTINDSTTMVSADPPRRFELRANIRPLLRTIVVMEVEPVPEGTKVVMRETAIGGLLGLLRPVVDSMMKPRNAESLRRLGKLIESRNSVTTPSAENPAG